MISSQKVREIAKRLSHERRVLLKVDGLKVKKWKDYIKVEGPIETDREHFIETIQFYLPQCKIISQ